GAIAVRFLRRIQPRYLAQMSIDRGPGLRDSLEITGERGLFDPAMHARLFKCLESGRLCMGKPRLGAAFGKRPPPVASLYEQKLNPAFSHAITNRCDLLGFAQLTKMRHLEEFWRSIPRPASSRPGLFCTHGCRLRDAMRID